MQNRTREINQVRSDVARVQRQIRSCDRTLEQLTTRLGELELYSSSNEEDIVQLQVGDRVVPTTEPHLGRYGTVETVGNYWVTVKADWAVIVKGKRQIRYKKARHNLRVYVANNDE